MAQLEGYEPGSNGDITFVFDALRKNSDYEVLTVEASARTMFFRAMFEGAPQTQLSPEGAAEFMWAMW